MMISDRQEPQSAYVWIWLPGATDPVVAGQVFKDGQVYGFRYGRSYLARNNAISIYEPELPLGRGDIFPDTPHEMAGSLQDASPDAWGRRVIINQLTGRRGDAARNIELDELSYMLHSGSDRIGALDFQESADIYMPRHRGNATLEQLMNAAEMVQRGEPVPHALQQALFQGSLFGGARPKAQVEDADRKYIAKFSSTKDTYNVVKSEFIAMRMAARIGLNTANVKLETAAGKDVLLVERFDRPVTSSGETRRSVVSALTILGLTEMEGRYAGYDQLAEVIRHRFTHPNETLEQLFSRLVLNVLVSNTDDHARNHAAFWDGKDLELTPAFDICPQFRMSREVNQAMCIAKSDRRSLLATCVVAANEFHLSAERATEIIKNQTMCIEDHWEDVCDEADLSIVDRDLLWRSQFLNPYAFEGFDGV